MKYKGVIIEESLGDKAILGKVKIIETKVEAVTPRHQTPWLTQWTLHTVEVPEEASETIAQEISTSFDPAHATHWYADYKNDRNHFIMYANKIFKVELQNQTVYKEARAYGISLGIPEYQLI